MPKIDLNDEENMGLVTRLVVVMIGLFFAFVMLATCSSGRNFDGSLWPF